MVALDGHHRYPPGFELFQSLDGMNERQSVDSALMEQDPRDHHKVNLAMNRVVDNIPEGAAKIIETLTHTILLVTKMCIRDMYKRSSHNTIHLTPLVPS